MGYSPWARKELDMAERPTTECALYSIWFQPVLSLEAERISASCFFLCPPLRQAQEFVFSTRLGFFSFFFFSPMGRLSLVGRESMM